jgi:ABC-type sugar transport system ATPase subunit
MNHSAIWMRSSDSLANLFVAGFIGSPPMNFVAATVNGSGSVGTDDEALNQIAHESLPVLPGALTGRRIMIGIRPEHLLVQNEHLAGHGAHIDLIEPMGQDTLLHVTVGHTPLIVTTRTRDFLPGQTVRLRPDPSKVIVIDQETSQTVFAQGEVYRGHKI